MCFIVELLIKLGLTKEKKGGKICLPNCVKRATEKEERVMSIMQELSTLRATLQDLCQMTDQIIEEYRISNSPAEGLESITSDQAGNFEAIYPLCMEPGFFKGKPVVAVVFPDGVRIETPTWKKLVEIVMKRCNADSDKHGALMELRNRIQGRSRRLLGSGSAGMRSPIKIDRGLYMETHYDTESLLRIMKTRILDAVGYDYGNIRVAIRNR